MRAFRQWLGNLALRFGLRRLTISRSGDWDDEWLIVFDAAGVIKIA